MTDKKSEHTVKKVLDQQLIFKFKKKTRWLDLSIFIFSISKCSLRFLLQIVLTFLLKLNESVIPETIIKYL